ncbi:MAG TPA: hypothetical protein VHC48_22055 [Puia sp.]|nr:hypothetical protein [Puia sp.]
MKLTFYCARHGQEAPDWDDFLKCVREEGYDGVETALPSDVRERDLILNGFAKHGLRLKAVHEGTVTPDFLQHARELESSLRSIIESRPFIISLQTGKDYFTFDQNTQLLLMSKRIALENGVNIVHKTQRGRFCFAVHVARLYLEAMPWLKLDLDLSQWYTVAGGYLEDQTDAVELALSRAAHVETRIGGMREEMGEMQDLRSYLTQWDKIVEKHHKMGTAELGFTCDPEMKNFLIKRYVK